MTTYYCENCDRFFTEEQSATVLVDGGYGYKSMIGCPDCHDAEMIVKAEACKICGAPIATGDYCDDCKYEVHKVWEAAVEGVMDIRLKRGENVSDDFLDCEGALLEFLEDMGVF